LLADNQWLDKSGPAQSTPQPAFFVVSLMNVAREHPANFGMGFSGKGAQRWPFNVCRITNMGCKSPGETN